MIAPQFHYLVCAFFGRYELDDVEILALFASEEEAKHHISFLNAKLDLLKKSEMEIETHSNEWFQKFPEPAWETCTEEQRDKYYDAQFDEMQSFSNRIGHSQGMIELVGTDHHNPNHINFVIKTCPKKE